MIHMSRNNFGPLADLVPMLSHFPRLEELSMFKINNFFTRFALVGMLFVWSGLASSHGQTVSGPGLPSNLRCE